MSDKPTVEQLEKLSAKATQGEWESRMHPVRNEEMIGLPDAQEGFVMCRNGGDGAFIAALVNWFRSSKKKKDLRDNNDTTLDYPLEDQ